MNEPIAITLNPRDVDRILKRLAKYQGRPLQERMQKALYAGASLMIRPMRAQAARHTGGSGATAASVKVKKLKLRSGETAAYSTRPTTPQAHLVIRGHRIVPQGTNTGRRTRADPYVGRAIAALEPQIRTFVDEQIASL